MMCRLEEESFLHSHSYLPKSSIRGRIVSENCFQEYGFGLGCPIHRWACQSTDDASQCQGFGYYSSESQTKISHGKVTVTQRNRQTHDLVITGFYGGRFCIG